jgi:hypothetical protein
LPVIADSGIPFHVDLYSLKFAVLLSHIHSAARACKSARFNGLECRKSAFVVIGYDDDGRVWHIQPKNNFTCLGCEVF